MHSSWRFQVTIAAGSMLAALGATHVLWPFLQHTPLLPGFAAAVVSGRVAGRRAGLLAVLVGAAGYAWFPPPVDKASLPALVFGFLVISGSFAWLVARAR